jgi:hypothetical protein
LTPDNSSVAVAVQAKLTVPGPVSMLAELVSVKSVNTGSVVSSTALAATLGKTSAATMVQGILIVRVMSYPPSLNGAAAPGFDSAPERRLSQPPHLIHEREQRPAIRLASVLASHVLELFEVGLGEVPVLRALGF